MKYRTGRYKIPEMFPNLFFPKGYTIINRNETHLKIDLSEQGKSCYFQYLAPGESANIWLPSGGILTASHGFEIEEIMPRG